METFQDLIQSRRQWISNILEPWCRTASRPDLLLAEQEWGDIAGRAHPNRTLWLWAWRRFPALHAEGLATVNETHEVVVSCVDGRTHSGFPNARKTGQGQLFLITSSGDSVGPISIDEIVSIKRTVVPESPRESGSV